MAGGTAGGHKAQRTGGSQALQPRAEGPGATLGRPTSPGRKQETAQDLPEQPSKVTDTDCERAKLGDSFETVRTVVKKQDRLEWGKRSVVAVQQGHGAQRSEDGAARHSPALTGTCTGRRAARWIQARCNHPSGAQHRSTVGTELSTLFPNAHEQLRLPGCERSAVGSDLTNTLL